MTKRIGLMVGREWSFPPAFIEEVNRRQAGVTAEFVTVGAASMDEARRTTSSSTGSPTRCRTTAATSSMPWCRA